VALSLAAPCGYLGSKGTYGGKVMRRPKQRLDVGSEAGAKLVELLRERSIQEVDS